MEGDATRLYEFFEGGNRDNVSSAIRISLKVVRNTSCIVMKGLRKACLLQFLREPVVHQLNWPHVNQGVPCVDVGIIR